MSAIIYKPTRSASQSGTAATQKWVLSFVHNGTRKIEPVMGWTSTKDTMQEVMLKFNSQEEAEAYAKQHNIEYQLIPNQKHKMILRSYASNFK